MGTGSILALVGLVIGVGLLFMVLGVGALVISVVSVERGSGFVGVDLVHGVCHSIQ